MLRGMKLIEELKRLDSEATKAPWHFGKAKWLFPQFVDENAAVAEQWVCSYDGKPPLEGTRADAEFKSFLRNNLPHIIALLEAAEKMKEAMELLQASSRCYSSEAEWSVKQALVTYKAASES